MHAWKRILILLALVTMSVPPVFAEGAPGAADAPHTWAGEWAARGITPVTSLTALWIGDISGGLERGGVYNTLGSFGADIDIEKLVPGWKGASAGAEVYWIRGRSASWYYVGDALTVSNLDGFDSIRLYQGWLQQDLLDDRLSLRAGVLSADEEFCGTQGGALFTNGAFGWSAGVGANIVNGGPIYFSPALGARVAVKPGRGWTFQGGLYDGDSFDSPAGDPLVNQHGLHFSVNAQQGAFALGEGCREWAGESAGGPLAGSFRLGFWHHSAEFADNLRDARGQSFTISGLDPASYSGNGGWYGALEQSLWAEKGAAGQGVSAWIRVASAPADRSALEWASDGGFNWTGALPGRDADVFGIGVASAYVSRDVQRQVIDANFVNGTSDAVPDFERVVEAAYQLRWNDHWSVTPDLQWVQHPGMTRDTRDAWVAGLRVTFE